MNLKTIILVLLLFGLFYFTADAQNGGNVASITWNIDNVDSIEGHATTKLGDPVVVETSRGKAVHFDGIDDGLLVTTNPLEGATAFTVEVVFKPDSSYPDNQAQRFVHIQNPGSEDRRILIELRLSEDHQWYLDTFINSDLSSKTLALETAVHPVGEWYHAALVYENRLMIHYVNGIEELSGEVDYLPITGAYTSLGTRMNKRSWFKGAIRTLKVTHKALSPDEFLIQNTGIQEKKKINDYQILQNYPNPFNSTTAIQFKVAKKARIKLQVLNALGEKVATLVDGIHNTGWYSIHWNGRDKNDHQVVSGLYFYRLIIGEQVFIKKMLLLK
ncbi:T9SS type A sorting domain-containing protein [candidate division KSB1 bacterium]|nr:T9SS type A sorting domain-containing protein [candidate division KSB1 bacterium]